MEQNITINGVAVVLTLNTEGKVVSITFPLIRDDFGNPQVISVAYGVTVAAAWAIAAAFIASLPLPV